MSAKYKSPSFLLPNELNTSANTANDTGINSLYSMKFDGSSYISLGDDVPPFNQTTSKFSISLWLYNTVYPNEGLHCIFENRLNYAGGSSNNSGIVFESVYHSGQYGLWFRMYPPNSSPKYVTFPQTELNEDEWNHIAIVFDGTESNYQDRIEIYVNNSPVTLNYPSSNVPTQIAGASAGNEFRLADGYQPNFVGQMDEFCIFSKSLTSTDVSALYNSGTPAGAATVLNLGASAYYPLGEQAQNSGYPGNTTPANNVWQFPNGVLQDYVMNFDGATVGDYIDAGDVPLEGVYTISFWINPDFNPSLLYFLLDKTDVSPSISARVTQSFNNTIRFQIGSSNFSSTDTLTNNSWNNVILIANGSSSKIYINNGIAATGTLPTAPNTANSLFIGTDVDKQDGYYFNGQMSNVVVWNSDQSANIDNIYNNGSPQTSYTVTPQNWWKLNADSVYTPSAPNYTTALGFNSTKNDFDKVTVGDLTTLATPSNDITISLWAKLRTIANAQDKYGMPYSDKSGYIYFSLSGSVLKYESNLRGTTNLKDTTGIAPSELLKWHHIVVTFSGTEAKLYYNSQLLDTGTAGSATNFGEDTTIGTLRNTTNPTYSFNGFISNVAVLQSALSASQVSTLFNFGTPETNISFSPIHNWKLDNLTTGLNDTGSLASNNGTAGSVNGTGPVQESTPVAVVPSWKIPTALPIPSINYTTALDFNGNSDYIRVDNFSGVSNSFSVSLWFNLGTSALVQRNFLELMNPSTANFNQRIFMLNTGTIYVSQNSGAGGSAQLSTSGINDGKWHHLYATISSNGSIKVILDNNSTASGSSSQSFSSAISTVNIGVNFWNQSDPTAKRQYFLGQMSNVAVYNSALTDPQVSTLYNNGTPETAISFSPISWWKLDTGGSTITDYAGSNSGTNNGATKVDSNVYTGVIPVNGVSTTLPSTALQQSDLQFDSPYSNYSLDFDGAGDYIDCTDNDMFSFGNGTTDSPFSVSFWAKLNSVSGTQPFLSKDTTSPNREWAISIFSDSSNGVRIFLKNQGGDSQQSIDSSTALTTGVWYHITTTYDGRGGSDAADGLSIYINGSLDTPTNISKGTYTAMSNTTAPVYIGKYSSSEINGKIDETAIFNTALTEAQVLEIYNNGKPSNLDNFSGTAPISWWRLGENAYFNTGTTPGPEFTVPNSIAGAPNGIGSGTVTTMLSADAPGTYANGIGDGLAITDRVGDAPLSVANSQSYNMIPDDKVPYVPGYVGAQTTNASEMTFDGTNYFNAGNASSLNWGTGDGSVSCWFKTSYNAPGVQDLVINGSYASGGKGYILYLDSSERVGFYLDDNSSPSGVLSTSSVNDGDWHHVVGVRDSGTMKLYLDGSEIATGTDNTGNIDISDPLIIGAGQAFGGSVGNFFNGQIDEVAIFDEALTPDQIKFDLYEPTTTGKTADIENNTNLPTPLAWYRMGD